MYELFVIFPSQNKKEELKSHRETVEGFIKNAGGTVKKTFDVGARPLAYPIIKQGTRHNNGYIFDIYFEIKDPSKLSELEEELRLEENVLRFLITEQESIPEQHPLLSEEEKTTTGKTKAQKTTTTQSTATAKTAQKNQEQKEEPKDESQEKEQKEEEGQETEEQRPSQKNKASIEEFDEKIDEILEEKSEE